MIKTALIIVDVQYDFLPPHGSLAVPDGQAILPVIQDLLDKTKWDWPVIIASQDYHPSGHISFASSHPPNEAFSKKTIRDARGTEYEQTLWPDHCVQGTKGAEIDLSVRGALEPWGETVKVVRKGTHLRLEAYSAFEGYITEATTTELVRYLRSMEVEKVAIVGLATDFCVLQTALSALSASFETTIIAPAVRGISEADANEAFDKLMSLGGKIIGRQGTSWEQELRAWA
ncbi:hypothetical protein I317_00613 [Kwoniella heveanensis CBS 569]|nr:hypothetical protein I317_00613 [Kwoniella heveanensis CBS 569]